MGHICVVIGTAFTSIIITIIILAIMIKSFENYFNIIFFLFRVRAKLSSINEPRTFDSLRDHEKIILIATVD